MAGSEKKGGFFSRLVRGLTKSRDNLGSSVEDALSGYTSIDDDFYDEIEEILVMGDVGIGATTSILNHLKQKVKEQHVRKPAECRELLLQSIKDEMNVGQADYRFEQEKSVVLVVGVNGVGKTTSIGKLAGLLKQEGRKVVLAAADTFRAAAGEQLDIWAKKTDVPMISGQEGSDPGSVVYDAIAAAINRIIDREYPEAYKETLVVLDGTTGQNALAQAREFKEVTNVTGIILTKLDGTAKGGIAIAIHSELGIPVKYIGVGERVDDLQKFDADQFVNALFDVKKSDL